MPDETEQYHCAICGDVRAPADLATRMYRLTRRISYPVSYCNDRADCKAGAERLPDAAVRLRRESLKIHPEDRLEGEGASGAESPQEPR